MKRFFVVFRLLLLLTLFTVYQNIPDSNAAQLPDAGSAFAEYEMASASIDLSLLSGNPISVKLRIFNGEIYVADRSKFTRYSNESFAWSGEIRGVPNGWAGFVVRGHRCSGILLVGENAYRIIPSGQRGHTISRIDMTKPMHCEAVEPPKPLISKRPTSPGKDDGSIIDVMILYTPEAGLLGDIKAEALLSINETNWSYEKSGINQRLRLVYIGQVNYTESGNLSTDFWALQSPDDGILDDVHALRDQYGADVVGLWVKFPGCGRAYIMDVVDVSYEQYAFSVTQRLCATVWGFAHEMGHNMGLRHDWYMDPNETPFPYAHGYLIEEPNFCIRTIMAYNDKCENQGIFTIPLPFWSNPDTSLFSWALGVPETDPEPANNAKALNNTAWTVANFRASVCDCAIGGVCYFDGELSPDNPCMACDGSKSPTEWSFNDGYDCDDGLFCNGEDSCFSGQCSESAGDPCVPHLQLCNEDTDTCDTADLNDDDNDDDDDDGEDDDNLGDLGNDMVAMTDEDDEGLCCNVL